MRWEDGSEYLYLLDTVYTVAVGILDGAHLLLGDGIEQHDRFLLAGSHQDRSMKKKDKKQRTTITKIC